MINEYEADGGMRIDRGNRSTKRKPVPLFPPQIPHNLTWDLTRVAMVGSRQLIAWAMAWSRKYQISHSGSIKDLNIPNKLSDY
jgi:hypothetical protein